MAEYRAYVAFSCRLQIRTVSGVLVILFFTKWKSRLEDIQITSNLAKCLTTMGIIKEL